MSDDSNIEWVVVGLVTTSVSIIGLIGNFLVVLLYKKTSTATALFRWLALIDLVFLVFFSFCYLKVFIKGAWYYIFHSLTLLIW